MEPNFPGHCVTREEGGELVETEIEACDVLEKPFLNLRRAWQHETESEAVALILLVDPLTLGDVAFDHMSYFSDFWRPINRRDANARTSDMSWKVLSLYLGACKINFLLISLLECNYVNLFIKHVDTTSIRPLTTGPLTPRP